MLLSGGHIYMPLLWGLCVLIFVESMTTSRPDLRAEGVATLNSLSRSDPAHVPSTTLNPEGKHTKVGSADEPPTEMFTTTATGQRETKPISSSHSSHGFATTRTAGATTISKGRRSTAESTAENEGQDSSAVTTAVSGAGHSSSVTVPHSPAVTISPGTAQPYHSTTIRDTTKVLSNQSRRPSVTSASPTSTSMLAGTLSVPTYPESTSKFTSTSSSVKSTWTGWDFTQKSKSSTTPTATNSPKSTSERPAHQNQTGTQTTTIAQHTTKFSFTPISSSQFSEVPRSSSTITNSPVSNGTTGILFPLRPKRLPVPSATSPKTTPTPNKDSKISSTIETCSTRSVVKQCLVIIAVLAVVATIFIVSTIVLCTKLSARKYKLKRSQPGTEMMCISTLLPERNHNYTRQRNHITNGVLVFPAAGDSDEDGADDITLSSFLPENERYV